MDQDPSFSIGITQLNSSNTRRKYDYDDDKWAENRSKLLHDPLAMKNQSTDKANKEVLFIFKSQCLKKNPKKEKKGSTGNFSTCITYMIVECFKLSLPNSLAMKSTSYLMISVLTIFAQDMQHCYVSRSRQSQGVIR
ncbi:hypothetical protein H5410_040101 [Solanum commersonii]|uniref:Uncharacterized protein n=1 Tax=Solanum commersonii TaxID=4109 RepID=A0A9J5XMX6_SOLCO|nr:hypothetical protein H5410_040101 [Solanum commersonii]